MSLVLHQAPDDGTNGIVTPESDARLYALATANACGIVQGVQVTSIGGSSLQVSSGWGVVFGRCFTVEQETILAETSTGESKKGRLLIRIDLSAAEQPIKFITQVADVLPALTQEDINAGGAIYELPLAEYSVNEISVSNLVDVSPKAQSLGARLSGLAAEVDNLQYSNAGAHNAVYRGKALGGSVSEEQYAAIKAGTFDDLYIGDYWTIGGVNYRIAAFDYFLNNGDPECTDHHVVIVPDTCLYNKAMNSTNTTGGGYVGSAMYKRNLEQAKTTIKNAFSDHILKHRIYLTNAVANGRASGGAFCDSEVDLMCEHMVYGSGIYSPVSDGANVPANYRLEKSQLPLFQHEPSRICNRTAWWLRDVIDTICFANVIGNGNAGSGIASASYGVRPYFCIY